MTVQDSATLNFARLVAMLRTNGRMAVPLLAERAKVDAEVIHQIERMRKASKAPARRGDLVRVVSTLKAEGLMTEEQFVQANKMLMVFSPPPTHMGHGATRQVARSVNGEHPLVIRPHSAQVRGSVRVF